VGIDGVTRAVFLDRDGVINRNVLNPRNAEHESPHAPQDFQLHDGALEAMAALQRAGWRLFLVSNQPSYAKGKTSLEAITAIHDRLKAALDEAGITFDAFYYCYHHPDGVVEGYSGACDCRKPSPYFLRQAARDFGIDLGRSWMVGDRASDIACGKAAGTYTIRVHEVIPGRAPLPPLEGEIAADRDVTNLQEAAALILAAG
jgi:D-glycero-D-manno-heptose 1,7-bisphosphate phosphatase